MQVKALKSFQGRHGFIRQGQTVNLEDGYARDLAKNKLVEIPHEGDGGGKAAAPRRSGVAGSVTPPVRPVQLGDGPSLTPLSSRAAQARPKKTPVRSVGGGKKGRGTRTQAPKESDPKGGAGA